jgi:FAD/FMN-containing dehydrogenase
MRTVPKLPQLIWYQAKYSSLPEMAEALQKMAFSVEQPDAFMAYQITGQGLYACYGFNKTPGVITITPLEANLQQASVKISQTPANLGHAYRQNWSPDAYCPAVDYFIDPDKLPIFLSFLNECLHDKLLVPYIHGLLILAVRRPPVDRLLPFEAASFGTTPLKFLVGFYPIIPIQDVAGLGRIRALLQETLALCIQLGGRPYLYGYHELDESTKHHLYGPHYAHLQSVRSQLDPHHLVNHGIF